MNKLFDQDPEEEENKDVVNNQPEETDDDEQIVKSIPRDKIFSNDYNTGNLDFEEFDLPRVDSFYAEENLKECYDSHEYARLLTLENLVDEYFQKTELYRTLANKKKIPKQIQPQVFVAIREQFRNNDFTGYEIFMKIADYFRISYDSLYENIPSLYREELVRELDEKYHVLKKKGVKRLF